MPPKISSSPKRILVLDTETAMRWFWYDGKGTRRLQMIVGQWADNSSPFGWIILPRILLEDSLERYVGLPVTDRVTALENFRTQFEKADLVVGHNVRSFDFGTLNGERLLAELPRMLGRPIHDTLRDMHKVDGQSRSLDNLTGRRLEGVEKPHVHPKVWEAAFNDYEPAALREVWNRCTADVMLHWELHQDLLSNGWLKAPRATP